MRRAVGRERRRICNDDGGGARKREKGMGMFGAEKIEWKR
jgi:hypothetical protein